MNVCNFVTLFGTGMLLMASALSGSGVQPFSFIISPRYLIRDMKNSLFRTELKTVIIDPSEYFFYVVTMLVVIFTFNWSADQIRDGEIQTCQHGIHDLLKKARSDF